jgi:hypothetical protein
MYASVRRYQFPPTAVEDIKRLIGERFVPRVSQAPGFIAYYVVDAGEGVVCSVSVFQDRNGIDESDRLAAAWVKEDLAQYYPNPPEITEGEVVVHRTG